MALVDVLADDDVDRDELLRLAGALESASEHPVARAIATAAARVGPLPAVADFANLEGLGVQGVVDGHAVLVGRSSLLERVVAAAARRPGAGQGERRGAGAYGRRRRLGRPRPRRARPSPTR